MGNMANVYQDIRDAIQSGISYRQLRNTYGPVVGNRGVFSVWEEYYGSPQDAEAEDDSDHE